MGGESALVDDVLDAYRVLGVPLEGVLPSTAAGGDKGLSEGAPDDAAGTCLLHRSLARKLRGEGGVLKESHP